MVISNVTAIIDRPTFYQVQSQLHARRPKVIAPRVTTRPILPTCIVIYASCKGGMTLCTGTSKTGGVYRYYTCGTCASKGKTSCKCRSVQINKLDDLVTAALADRLFEPAR